MQSGSEDPEGGPERRGTLAVVLLDFPRRPKKRRSTRCKERKFPGRDLYRRALDHVADMLASLVVSDSPIVPNDRHFRKLDRSGRRLPRRRK